MRISKELAEGLRWLSETEEWSDEDKAEAKDYLKRDPAYFSHFFTVLIAAKRAGYRYYENGRYVRLAEFCAANGLPDPYQGQFTDSQVDGDAVA
ncbi:hypothetical protein NDR89_15580 [Cupriavidus gilardii]|uniref:Uncharacterized protein n=1 Tax=Cupriavidus gilardii TaxID=82541 RepID=A0ABY4VVY2_9BURK|nr:hypothetical protein [Cupriavidus gilardii]USE81140.1 hypothetical protein NDR89_15580 [Cupriavidus gilardii]